MKNSVYASIVVLCWMVAPLHDGKAFAANDFERPEPAEGFAYPEEYCTNRGVRVELDETDCLRIGDRAFMAKCDMSLNNTIWRPTGDACDAETPAASGTETTK